MKQEHWLDKYIEEQKGQREIMERICNPHNPAELCEYITETDECYLQAEGRE